MAATRSLLHVLTRFSDFPDACEDNAKGVARSEAAKIAALELDEDSTDVGSSFSDAESACSSIATRASAAKGRQGRNCRNGRNNKSIKSTERRCSLPQGLDFDKNGYFSNTPLEPIPGTPVTLKGLSFEPVASEKLHAERIEKDGVQPTSRGFRPPPGLSPPVPNFRGCLPTPPVLTYNPPSLNSSAHYQRAGAVSSPVLVNGSPISTVPPGHSSTRARDDILTTAKQHASPLKVTLPGLYALDAQCFDPALPVKKTLEFFDELGEVSAMMTQKLDSSRPAKKKVSDFLLKEPCPVLPMVVRPR